MRHTQENAEMRLTEGLQVLGQRKQLEVAVDGSVTKKMDCEVPLISLQVGLVIPSIPMLLPTLHPSDALPTLWMRN